MLPPPLQNDWGAAPLSAPPPPSSYAYVYFFNLIFAFKCENNAWTERIIVPLHEQGNFSDPNTYRDITLNNCLGHLFCHVLNSRISNHVENLSFLAKEQAGFCKSFIRLTNHLFLKHQLTNIVVEMVNQINYTYVLSTSRKPLTLSGMRVCY